MNNDVAGLRWGGLALPEDLPGEPRSNALANFLIESRDPLAAEAASPASSV
jgi:hypothetical protein